MQKPKNEKFKEIKENLLETKTIEENKTQNILNPEENETKEKRKEPEKDSLHDEYIAQLKENNNVLKDLLRNKNKEIIALELKIKKDKLEKRKEIQEFK